MMPTTSRVAQLPPPQTNNLYRDKYKGIALCLGMLSTALAGTYVNFGVFTLYNDKVRGGAIVGIAWAIGVES